ncbi:hypothetical protein ALO48_102112 [Pseudomonas syringae pv. rhaphiolepidis]|nr:hypothetical protein ALO48_102112 [Pseudomonas syringae pv. rhaphiolepidis]
MQAQSGFCNMIEQVLVSSIECLQRLILLLGLANEIKFSERTDEQGHWRENSVQSKVCQ